MSELRNYLLHFILAFLVQSAKRQVSPFHANICLVYLRLKAKNLGFVEYSF